MALNFCMKRIEQSEHDELIEVFEHYKKFHNLYGNVRLKENDDQIIRQRIIELEAAFDYYNILLMELNLCLRAYNETRIALKTKMYPSVRKMRSLEKSKKH